MAVPPPEPVEESSGAAAITTENLVVLERGANPTSTSYVVVQWQETDTNIDGIMHMVGEAELTEDELSAGNWAINLDAVFDAVSAATGMPATVFDTRRAFGSMFVELSGGGTELPLAPFTVHGDRRIIPCSLVDGTPYAADLHSGDFFTWVLDAVLTD